MLIYIYTPSSIFSLCGLLDHYYCESQSHWGCTGAGLMLCVKIYPILMFHGFFSSVEGVYHPEIASSCKQNFPSQVSFETCIPRSAKEGCC